MKVWCAQFLEDYGYGEFRFEFIGVFADRESAIWFVENEWPDKDREFSGFFPDLVGDTWGGEYAEKTVSLWEEELVKREAVESQ